MSEEQTVITQTNHGESAVQIGQIDELKINVSWGVPSALQRLYDRMPPASHATLKWLMDTHHFSPSELYVACKLGALVAPKGQIRQAKTAWFDYGCGAFFLVPTVALLLLLFAAMLATVGTQVPLVDRLPIIGAITITMLTIYATVALYVWPNVTARKVVRALAVRDLP